MSHVVVMGVGVTSKLNAELEIANRLRRRGHTVTFVSPNPKAEGRVAEQGFPFVLLERESELMHVEFDSNRSLRRRNWIRRIAIARRRRQRFLDTSEVMSVLGELDPDLLLIETEVHHYILDTSGMATPTLLLETHCSARRAVNVPPLSSPRIPTHGAWSSALVYFEWKLLYLRRRTETLKTMVLTAGHDDHRTMRMLADSVSLQFADAATTKEWQHWTFRHIPTLYLSAWEFDFPHEVTDEEWYVGPMVFLERDEIASDPRWLELMERLDRNGASVDGNRPLIYCTMGSILADRGYYERVIEAFRWRPEYDLILSLGSNLDPVIFGQTPENVHIFDYVPQLEILRRADLMLTHGGISAINECIVSGVPMIAYSGEKIDQNGNSARVAFHGLGLMGDRRADTSEEIASTVDRVLTDPRFTENVDGMREIYMAYREADRSTDRIEKYLVAASRQVSGRPGETR